MSQDTTQVFVFKETKLLKSMKFHLRHLSEYQRVHPVKIRTTGMCASFSFLYVHFVSTDQLGIGPRTAGTYPEWVVLWPRELSSWCAGWLFDPLPWPAWQSIHSELTFCSGLWVLQRWKSCFLMKSFKLFKKKSVFCSPKSKLEPQKTYFPSQPTTGSLLQWREKQVYSVLHDR